MKDRKGSGENEIKRETVQLEREEIRSRIAEILETDQAKLESEAERIAPGFDYEKAAAELKAEEEAELAALGSGSGAPGPERESSKDAKDEKPLPKAVVLPSRYPGSPHVYKTAFGRAVFGDKNGRVMAASVLLLCVFAAYQAWDHLVPKTVNIEYRMFDSVQHISVTTTARTAGEVMEELTAEGSDNIFSVGGEEFSFSQADLLDTNEDLPVKNGMELEIRHASEATAKVAGKDQNISLVPGTVGENLRLNGIAFDDDDEIKPAQDSKVDEDTKIVVNEVHYNIEEKTEKVEAVSRVILDPSLTSGVQQTEEGNDGEGVFTYTTKYVNGKNKGTEREVKEWITEPHDNVLRLGTSATGNSGEYVVARTFTANTTAYTARSGARGAIGQVVHVGTCAVDPRYVSLRSEMWIEGYGYAYANDTGGAVKGNVVDLYMSSRSQCINWGRRNKTAYVLIPEESDE